MSRSTTIFVGLFGAFAVSIFAMVIVPQKQLGSLEPTFTEEEGRYSDIYPVANAAADQGRAIYVQQGCFTCHSQQIRDPQMGTDIERGWGPRRTVARDYIYDTPALLGSSRMGPDLSNVGAKDWRNNPKGDLAAPKQRDAQWHYAHLYAPREFFKDSNHPSYRYLFDEKPIVGQRADDALELKGADAPAAGRQIVPSNEAKSLVAYLLSLDRSHDLPELKRPGATAAAAAPAAAPAAGAAPAPATGTPAGGAPAAK